MVRRHLILMCVIVSTIVAVFLQSCTRMRGSPGYLRGGAILYVRFPLATSQEEAVVVGDSRVASRGFNPITAQTDINRVILSDTLCNDLDMLRTDWCAQSLPSLPATQDDAAYRVVFQCGYEENPVFYVNADDLPEPLRELIELVPQAQPNRK